MTTTLSATENVSDMLPPARFSLLEHDPEKWKPVFRKDHAQLNRSLCYAAWAIAPSAAAASAGLHHSFAPRSRAMMPAVMYPAPPEMAPPGWPDEPAMYRLGMGVR